MPRADDITGQRYGRLIGLRPDRAPGRHKRWIFCCDCGNERSMFLSAVKKGDSKSCGCLRAERNRERSLVHGHAVGHKVTPTRRAYTQVKSRCENRADPLYGKFGGAGVKLCARWASFSAFLEDMGERPPGTVLGRLKNTGDFEPANCIWTSKRKPAAYENILVRSRGADVSVLELARLHQVNPKQLWTRIKFLEEDADEAIERLKHEQ